MYAGKLVEKGKINELIQNPLHPYTQGLLESVPARCLKYLERGEYLKTIPGSVPGLYDFVQGCRFHDRCSYAMEDCARREPKLSEIEPGHFVSCWKTESGAFGKRALRAELTHPYNQYMQLRHSLMCRSSLPGFSLRSKRQIESYSNVSYKGFITCESIFINE